MSVCHLRLNLVRRYKNTITADSSVDGMNQTIADVNLSRCAKAQVEAYQRQHQNGEAGLDNVYLYWAFDEQRFFLVNPFIDIPEDWDNDGVPRGHFFEVDRREYEKLYRKKIISYDSQDSWLRTSAALGITYGVWQTSHFMFDGSEDNLCLLGPYMWGHGFTSGPYFNPFSLVFPCINGVVAGLTNYVFQVYSYKSRFGHEPSTAIKCDIAKQSAGLAFATVLGTLGWELGLQAAKMVLIAANITPYGIGACVVLSVCAGFGMALTTVLATLAKEKLLYDERQSSWGALGKLFLSSFLQGVAWWIFRLVPFAAPILQVGKAVVNGLVTLLGVTALAAAVRPKESIAALPRLSCFSSRCSSMKDEKEQKGVGYELDQMPPSGTSPTQPRRKPDLSSWLSEKNSPQTQQKPFDPKYASLRC